VKRRIRKIRRRLAHHKIDALLVSYPPNIRYLTGFTSSNAYLVVTASGRSVFLTDGRYIEAAQKSVEADAVELIEKDGLKNIAGALKGQGVRRLGFESEHVSHARAVKLIETLGARKCKPVSGVVESVRAIKEPEEVAAIRKAVRLAEGAFRHVVPLLRPGVRERDIAVELEFYFMAGGGDQAAFDPLVAFGPHSSVPHHSTGRRKLRETDVVLIDWGVRVGGYSSDLTRTLLPPRMRRRTKAVYQVVLEAQGAALERVRSGTRLSAPDKAARQVMEAASYGRHFTHSLGHGLGLEVHEQPGLTRGAEGTLRAGMVVTVEPGIYLPGQFGVRIEDDVLVTAGGHEVLSRLPKRARSWG